MSVRLPAALIAAFFVFIAGVRAAPASTDARRAPWLLVSDVHFNPVGDARTVAALVAAPVAQWQAVFAQGSAQPSRYFEDTNDALLESALGAMRADVPNPPVVVIAGDFLAHEFPERFARLLPGASTADYDAFVDKTIAFLAARFGAAYPHAQFVIAVGNNDGYCGDYRSTPGDAFLAHMAAAWEPLVDRGGAAPDFVRDFSAGGYYTTSLPAVAPARGRAIVLNSVFWSAKYRNACGTPGDDPGSSELAWLTGTLAAPAGAYRWLLTHIPPSIDDYSSLRAGMPVPFLSASYEGPLLAALAASAPAPAAFVLGHLHHGTYQLVDGGVDRPPLPGLVVPSISPVQGNNPAFVAADVDAADGSIVDATTWALPLAAPGAAWVPAYAFDAAYGTTRIDAPNLVRLQSALASDAVLRDAYARNYNSLSTIAAVVPGTWRWYVCGNRFLDSTAYAACVAGQTSP